MNDGLFQLEAAALVSSSFVFQYMYVETWNGF